MIPESILRTFLILLLAAMEAGAQRTEPKEVSAARICAEGYRLYEQKHYAEAEARLLTGILESEKTVKATSMRGGCLVQLARTQQKEGKYVDAEANARRAVAIFERFPLSGNLGLSTALIVLGDALEDLEKYSEAVVVVQRAWTLDVGNESDQSAQYRGIPFRRHLGRLYLKNKEYDRAATMLQENVSLLEKPGITGHTEVVPALNELAAVFIAQCKLTEAEELLHRALTLSDRWPETVVAETLLATLDEYGEVMKLSNRDAAAKQFSDRARAIREHYASAPQ
jgi:tetratricopeptide (TPR) repeat protein